jgi:hypothetical protein
MPAIKDSMFFTTRYHLGLGWYQKLFCDCGGAMHVGEFSADYFASEQARERIAHHIPDVRIIITLREPIARLYSHYRLSARVGGVKAKHSFERFVTTYDYPLRFARYAENVRAWRDVFGAANVLIAIYEDLNHDPQRFLDQICEFVGLPRVDLATLKRGQEPVNSAPTAPRSRPIAIRAHHLRNYLQVRGMYRTARFLAPVVSFLWGGKQFQPLSPHLAGRLRQQFLGDIEELEEILQRDLSFWKKPAADDGRPEPDPYSADKIADSRNVVGKSEFKRQAAPD